MKNKIIFPVLLMILMGTGKALAFEDVYINHPYYDAIRHYEELDLIEGYSNQTFKAEQQVNRVEMLKMILKIKDVDLETPEELLPFTDIMVDQWYMPYLRYSYKMKYVQGYSDLTFRPENNVSLAETLSILFKVYDYPITPTSTEEWFKPYLDGAEERGLLNLLKNKTPHYKITRGEVLALIYKIDTGKDPLVHVILDEPYTLKTLPVIDEMIQNRPELAQELAALKTHVEDDIHNDYELPVKVHIQQRALSCEVASLKTVLAYQGTQENESVLFQNLKKAEPYEHDKELNVWGNPHLGFVGDVDGSQIKRTGYGVYWDPIADLAKKYMPGSYSFKNKDIPFLLDQVIQGKPVIIWGYMNFGDGVVDISWSTPEGEAIYAVNGQHTFTVIGFEGDIKDPTGIVLIDPIKGKIVQSKERFLDNWSVFQNSGVVVE